jgi:hypothetical protein
MLGFVANMLTIGDFIANMLMFVFESLLALPIANWFSGN